MVDAWSSRLVVCLQMMIGMSDRVGKSAVIASMVCCIGGGVDWWCALCYISLLLPKAVILTFEE